MISLIGEQLNHLLTSFLTHFTYLALITILILSGLGAPMPEDIPLAFSGYLTNKIYSPLSIPEEYDDNHDGKIDRVVYHKVPNLYVMIVAGMVGVLLGDSVVFSIGRRGIDTNNIVARHLRKVLHSNRREKVERHFAKHGNLTVFVGRFMPGFRSLIFAFAGLSKMSYLRFMLIDGAATAISVPTFILLGHYFADRIQNVISYIGRLEHVVLFPVILTLFLAVGIIYYFRRRSRRAAAIDQP